MLYIPKIRALGLKEYLSTWAEMRSFTENRTDSSADEIWIVEHPPTFTLGQSGDHSHILNAGQIPIVQSDRGGQVTYHGPGQLVVYLLVDLVRSGIGVRALVRALEQSVIDLLSSVSIRGDRLANAPGVYVSGRKLAALGIRVKRGRCYHGLSLNVNMDLAPFSQINPCGYPGLEVTQLIDLGVDWRLDEVADSLLKVLTLKL